MTNQQELTNKELEQVNGGAFTPPAPNPRKDNNNLGTTKYRCTDCGHEYIVHLVGDVRDGNASNVYYGNDYGSCPKCGSINREILEIICY